MQHTPSMYVSSLRNVWVSGLETELNETSSYYMICVWADVELCVQNYTKAIIMYKITSYL